MPEFFDISKDDLYDENNEPSILNQEEALKQALVLFVVSDPDDYIRANSPGLAKSYLFKQLSDRNTSQLIFRLKNAIINEFAPAIYLSSIKVVPDPVKRLWYINIQYVSPYTGVPQTATILVKDFSDRQRDYQFIQINYTGVNLEQFSRMKKIMQPNSKMIFNREISKYTFGNYVLENLSNTSENFSTIQSILNE